MASTSAAYRRYNQSQKGRQRSKRYQQSQKGKAKVQRYRRSAYGQKHLKTYCKEWWRQHGKTKWWAWWLNTQYALTPQQFEAMIQIQEGCCAICQAVPKKFCVDHDHITGRVRGLLCYSCNRSLVGPHRDGDVFRRAADYLDATFDGRLL